MKVRIDTTAKVIAIEETVTFDELHKMLKGLFPDDYKQWKVDTNVKFELGPHTIVHRHEYPWWGQTYCATNAVLTVTDPGQGTFTIDADPNTALNTGVYMVDFQRN